MAEPVTIKHLIGKSIYFRFVNPLTGEVFDFDSNSWAANLGAAVQPKLAATENTDVGDADESLYVASVELDDLNSGNTPMKVLVQAVEDLATDELLVEAEITITAGRPVYDVMLAYTTIELASGQPPAAATYARMLQQLYELAIFKKEQTAAETRIYDAAGSAVKSKGAFDDDGTTATAERLAAP